MDKETIQTPPTAERVSPMSPHPQDRDNSPSSCAGLFIASHIGFDWPGVWVHLDIAAPVHAVSTSGLLRAEQGAVPSRHIFISSSHPGHALPPLLFLQSSSISELLRVSSSERFCVVGPIICGPASSQLQSL